MATPTPRVSDNPVVQEHYTAQAGLSVALGRAAAKLPADPNYAELLASLTREFQAASISISAEYYSELRDQAGVTGSFRPPILEPWPADQLTGYLETAFKQLEDATEAATQALAMSQNVTANSGVDEVFAAIDADPTKVRWARVTRPGACSLCMLAAIRGAVYRTETSASFRPHMQINGVGGDCRCTVEPSFTKYEPTAHIRDAQRLYAESTAGVEGSRAKQNAFRRALASSDTH